MTSRILDSLDVLDYEARQPHKRTKKSKPIRKKSGKFPNPQFDFETTGTFPEGRIIRATAPWSETFYVAHVWTNSNQTAYKILGQFETHDLADEELLKLGEPSS